MERIVTSDLWVHGPDFGGGPHDVAAAASQARPSARSLPGVVECQVWRTKRAIMNKVTRRLTEEGTK
jgi:hypothetical protein